MGTHKRLESQSTPRYLDSDLYPFQTGLGRVYRFIESLVLCFLSKRFVGSVADTVLKELQQLKSTSLTLTSIKTLNEIFRKSGDKIQQYNGVIYLFPQVPNISQTRT